MLRLVISYITSDSLPFIPVFMSYPNFTENPMVRLGRSFSLTLWSLVLLVTLVNGLRQPNILRQLELKHHRTRLGLSHLDDASYHMTTPSSSKDIDHVKEAYFTQVIDHFQPTLASPSFQQRYFLRTDYWDQAGRPDLVFLCVGGEGPPLRKDVLTDSVHCTEMVNIAAETGALLLALEHRYYGPSIPSKDFSLEGFKYLSTKQAVEDIKVFHSFITQQYLSGRPALWITFGGSYPGMLASFARIKYPHLIHAAIASSAPVYATVNMPGYLETQVDDFALTSIGGSKQCRDAVIESHRLVGDMLKNQTGKARIVRDFKLCSLDELNVSDNVGIFVGFGIFDMPAQENDPSCTTPLCNYEKICQAMLDPSKSLYDRLLYVYHNGGNSVMNVINFAEQHPHLRSPSSANAPTCRSINFATYIKEVSSDVSIKNTERIWLYQVCTNWGFLQTCESRHGCPLIADYSTEDMWMKPCTEGMGIPRENMIAGVADANAEYGGLTPRTSRIVYINGEVDPWRANSIIKQLSADQPVLEVAGASHHFWTHKYQASDSKNVQRVRQQISDLVKEYIKRPPVELTR